MTDIDDVYSSCVQKQFTADKLKKFAAQILLNEADDEEELGDIFRKKPEEKRKSLREKRADKKSGASQSKSAQSNSVILADDDDDDGDDSDDDLVILSNLSHDKFVGPTPPPTPPSGGVKIKRKRMNRDVENALLKLQKAQLAYKEDSDGDSVCIIDITSPAKEPDNQKQISVKIKCNSGIQRFPMKMIDSFVNIYKQMAHHVQVAEDQLTMFLNDRKIHCYDTPASIGLQVADIIDCYVRKPGDVSFDEDDSILEDPEVITLGVQTKASKSKLNIKIRMGDPLEKLMREFCKRQNISYENVIFQFDGETIRSHQTSSTLGLEDGDCIDVIEI